MIYINVMTPALRAALCCRRWYERYSERDKALRRAKRKVNPKQGRAAARKYYQTHLEKARKQKHLWRNANLEKARNGCREWSRANPAKRKSIRHRYRARKTNAGGSFTAEQFQALGNMCLCCGRNNTELAAMGLILVPDHILPIAKGGSSDISNIQPLCHGKDGCNNHKKDKYIDYRKSSICGVGNVLGAVECYIRNISPIT